jgi:hypothetical protein
MYVVVPADKAPSDMVVIDHNNQKVPHNQKNTDHYKDHIITLVTLKVCQHYRNPDRVFLLLRANSSFTALYR